MPLGAAAEWSVTSGMSCLLALVITLVMDSSANAAEASHARPFLGLTIDNQAPFDQGSGLVVQSVAAHGLAEGMGVRVGDHLLSANGMALAAIADLGKALDQLTPGQDLAFEISRDGAKLRLAGTPSPPPDAQTLARDQDALQAKLERLLRAPKRGDRAAFSDVVALLRRLEDNLPAALAGLRRSYPAGEVAIDVHIDIRSDRSATDAVEVPAPRPGTPPPGAPAPVPDPAAAPAKP